MNSRAEAEKNENNLYEQLEPTFAEIYENNKDADEYLNLLKENEMTINDVIGHLNLDDLSDATFIKLFRKYISSKQSGGKRRKSKKSKKSKKSRKSRKTRKHKRRH
jgi:hypothetical protein